MPQRSEIKVHCFQISYLPSATWISDKEANCSFCDKKQLESEFPWDQSRHHRDSWEGRGKEFGLQTKQKSSQRDLVQKLERREQLRVTHTEQGSVKRVTRLRLCWLLHHLPWSTRTQAPRGTAVCHSTPCFLGTVYCASSGSALPQSLVKSPWYPQAGGMRWNTRNSCFVPMLQKLN